MSTYFISIRDMHSISIFLRNYSLLFSITSISYLILKRNCYVAIFIAVNVAKLLPYILLIVRHNMERY